MGVLETKSAVEIAFDRGYDLVLISKNANPPVCKIMDYGKFKYHERKKLKEAQHRQTMIKIKELRMRPRIDEHDYAVKLDKARNFLEVGMHGVKSKSPLLNKRNKVKFIVRLVGREMAHAELGMKILDKFINDLKDIGEIEQEPLRQGNTITMVISPRKMEVQHNAKTKD